MHWPSLFVLGKGSAIIISTVSSLGIHDWCRCASGENDVVVRARHNMKAMKVERGSGSLGLDLFFLQTRSQFVFSRFATACIIARLSSSYTFSDGFSLIRGYLLCFKLYYTEHITYTLVNHVERNYSLHTDTSSLL